MGTLLDGSKIVTLLCVITCRNNMQCEYDMLMYVELYKNILVGKPLELDCY